MTRSKLRLFADTLRLPNWPSVLCTVAAGHVTGIALTRNALGPHSPVAPDFSGGTLALLLCGAALLYACGVLLNDAADADFDQSTRPSRLVPSGAMGRETVLNLGLLSGAAGIAALFFVNATVLAVGGALALCLLLYTWLHKRNAAASAFFMGLCRGLLFPLGGLGATSYWGGEMHRPMAILCAVGLLHAIYTAGISVIAGAETRERVSCVRKITGTTLLTLPFFVPPVLLAALFAAGLSNSPGNLALLVFLLLPAGGLATVALARRRLAAGAPGAAVGIALTGFVWIDAAALALFAGWAWLALPLAVLAATLLLRRVAQAT